MKRLIQYASFAVAVLFFVNGTASAAETISLAGDWRFEIGGTNSEQCPAALNQKIHLPGTIDDAHLGPPNPKAPTLEGPWRLSDYAGAAWYQRDIEIPAKWSGKRVTLFLERCRWVTTVWLDDQRIGSQDSLIAPHVYDFGTAVAPGKHRLTICVDNRVKIHLGKFVSALFGGTWGNMNGIIGRIELAATSPVWLDEVQVYPDVDKKLARVVVKIGNATGKGGSGTVKAGAKTVSATWDEKGGRVELEVDMAGAKLWDEFSPNLTELTVTLGEDRRTARFGMRKFAARGTQFTLNDRPLFLRGTLECSVFPLTGYPPTDVEAWRKIYQIEKSYGLNFIRFHSWCPPEAAFTAADIEGMLVQAEGPMANIPAGQDAARDAFIVEEYMRIVDTYGNHPSFCLMSLGNEFGGKNEVVTSWVNMLIHRDSRRLYSSPTSAPTTANRQWTETPHGRGIKSTGTIRDLSDVVAKDRRPIIGHEIGQWMYWPDSREIKKWNGVMALKNFELVRDDLKMKNLFDLEPQFVEASGKFATLLYKEEIEVLLRTPDYSGFSLLDLHDYPTQGTALVGPLDAFWESKGFITPEAYRRFCNATVPLLRMPKRTYTSTETFEATAQVAHFGAADLANAQPVWKITSAEGKEVAAGKLPALTVPTGKLTELGAIKASLANVQTPGKFTVTVALAGTQFANDWEIWVYPPAPAPSADVLVCSNWSDAKAALAAGKKVIFFPGKINSAHSMPGSFLPVFWSPVWFPSQKPNTMGLLCDPKHPLFAQFPTEMHSNWQWYDLMQHSQLFVLDETPADYRPLVQVIDNFARNHKLGVVFEGRVGEGQLLVCGFNLPGLTNAPAAQQLLASLYAYVGSPKFKPATPLSGETLEKLFTSPPTAKSDAAAPAEAAALLTPPPPREPRINGPKVYGVRPGSPFLYRIPCTGERPISFSAQNLPAGLTLGAQSGIITGKISAAGTNLVTLVAHNERGEARREFCIIVGNQLALTPPMGWNSWYIHYNRVTEATMRDAADQMIASGMADFGYQYVNIDDCWMKKKNDPPYRDTNGAVLPNWNFPDIKGLADYIHGKGLKAGLYTSPGSWTCGGYVGAYQHEATDARKFSEWGFDFLKYDLCSYRSLVRNNDVAGLKAPYQLMWGELQKLDRDIVFNLCQYGMGDVWNWGGEVGNCWRTTGDLGLEKSSQLPGFYNVGFSNARHWESARPGAWNDPDYILIGWVGDAHGMGQGKKTTLTPNEQYSYMSLWSLMAAPLIFSGDMAKLDAFTLNVLCNAEVIAVDQDPLGQQAKILRQTPDEFVLVKNLADGSKAVGLFNLTTRPRKISVSWNELGVSGNQHLRDLWRQKEIGTFDRKFEMDVPRHGVSLVCVLPTK